MVSGFKILNIFLEKKHFSMVQESNHTTCSTLYVKTKTAGWIPATGSRWTWTLLRVWIPYRLHMKMETFKTGWISSHWVHMYEHALAASVWCMGGSGGAGSGFQQHHVRLFYYLSLFIVYTNLFLLEHLVWNVSQLFLLWVLDGDGGWWFNQSSPPHAKFE